MLRSLFIVISVLIIHSMAYSQEQLFVKSLEEECVIPPDIFIGGGEDYSGSDRKSVQKLCQYDIHSDPSQDIKGEQKAVAACPKYNSTNPAIEFIKIPKGETREQIQAQCNQTVAKKNSGKLAKYKMSVTCANSASIIGYFHVSRALGIKYVPPAVLRTIDYQFHKEFARKAHTEKQGAGGPSWSRVYKGLSQFDPKFTTDDRQQSYGVLSVNPKGEQKTYDGVWHGGDNQHARLSNFMSQSQTYKRLQSTASIQHIVGTEFNSSNYTQLQQMKDVSDMIILDTLFGQKDRFGNTHSIYTWLVSNEQGEIKKWDLDDIEDHIKDDVESGHINASVLDSFQQAKRLPKDWKKQVRSRLKQLKPVVDNYLASKGFNHAFAENLLLKDNDCGLMDSNPMMKNRTIERINHISPETYEQLIKLHTAMRSGELDNYFSDYLLMTPKDLSKFKNHLNYVVDVISKKEQAGLLRKDLVVKSHFTPKVRQKTVDGLAIYDVHRSGVNVRTEAVLALGTNVQSLFKMNGVGQKTLAGDKVALIKKHPAVGKNIFWEVRIEESTHLPKGQIVFMWHKALK